MQVLIEHAASPNAETFPISLGIVMLILSENQSLPFCIHGHTFQNAGSNTFFYNQKKYRIERMTSQE